MNLKDLFIESLTDNKKLIIVLYALFIITFVVSWIIASSTMNLSSAAGNLTASGTPGGDTSAIELFIHNEWGGIVTYFASIFFGIFAVVMILFNAFNLASIGALFSNIMPNGGIMYIIYLIPHGIFEITGMVLQSAAGILLFMFVWKFIRAWRSSDAKRASDAFEMTKKTLIQSMVIMVIATVLILIAAPIEANVSIPFSEAVMGLFGLM